MLSEKEFDKRRAWLTKQKETQEERRVSFNSAGHNLTEEDLMMHTLSAEMDFLFDDPWLEACRAATGKDPIPATRSLTSKRGSGGGRETRIHTRETRVGTTHSV